MKFLNIKSGIRPLKRLWVLLLLTLVGCIVVRSPEIYKFRPIRFPHVAHGQKAELECADCHRSAATGDKAGMPGVKACKLCHEEQADERIKPFLIEGKPKWTDVTAIVSDVTFSHQKHLEKELACENCHTGVPTSKAVDMKFRVTKEMCLDCHKQKKVSTDCTVCHKEINQKWKPPTHDVLWKESHGQVARAAEIPPYYNNCAMCHAETTCTQCHQSEPPRNHTNQWRLRGHGIAAGMDRDKCMTCHTTNTCEQCHSQVAPVSHKTQWGSPNDYHCMNCHLDSSESSCAVCHAGAPSHAQAPHMPIGHSVTNDCRKCHGMGTNLKHPDPGQDCLTCHSL